jgi:hypothetical protein
MGIDGIASGTGVPGGPSPAEAYRLLDARRIDIDRTMTGLPPGDPARDELWQELESVLEKLREVVIKLAKLPAADLLALQAKATILSALLQPEGRLGPIIPEAERVALALSLTQDIARLPNG